MSSRIATVLGLALGCAGALSGGAALASDPSSFAWPASSLPSFARATPSAGDPDNYWKGLSYGVTAMAVGGKGIRGGFGGAANVAWTRAFDNNIDVSFRASAGYMPGVWKASPWGRAGYAGANFIQGEAMVGYTVDRARVWASIGGGGLKMSKFGGFSGGLNSVNNMFGERGKTAGYVTYGAGVDYAVTNNLTIGIAVHGVQMQR